MTISKEAENALKVQAMISGMTVEELAKQMYETDEIEFEVEDEPKKEKKTRAKKEKVYHAPRTIEDRPEFNRLKVRKKVGVLFGEHSIRYKDQSWPIPSRVVEYETELIKSPKIAQNVADMFSHEDESERLKADNGETRYIKLVSYSESVSFRVKEVGYAKVWNNNGSLKYKILLNKELKNNHINPDIVRSKFSDALNELIA